MSKEKLLDPLELFILAHSRARTSHLEFPLCAPGPEISFSLLAMPCSQSITKTFWFYILKEFYVNASVQRLKATLICFLHTDFAFLAYPAGEHVWSETFHFN